MKIVKTSNVSRIFADDLKTFDRLPAGNYKVCFHSMMGFYLEDADSFKLTEKPYGKHPQKIEKALRLFHSTDRSVGILLSGKKGMGKSMYARLLSAAFHETLDMPTIIIDEAYLGIVDFIESIKQPCMVLFDEFDKTFDGDATNIYGQPKQERNPNKESQNKLLGLFDGVSQTKRMYVITVNEIKKVNQFMINRPGRFHYHLQFNYPSMEEVQLYLADKLKPEFHNQINLVQRFATRFELNYDSLRAIAQDLNMGYSFLETMEDLNISTSENESVRYDIAVHHTNGVICKNNVSINLMSSSFNFGYPIAPREHLHVTFSPLEIDIQNKESFTAPADQVNFQIIYDSDNEKVTEESGITISKIVFTKPSYSRNFYGKELEVNPF